MPAQEASVSTYMICAWKAKHGSLEVSETQEAKRLQAENAR
jgi:hypothetical protein